MTEVPVARNAPAQLRPRDALLAPSTYLPPQSFALVTAVTTVRTAPVPSSVGGARSAFGRRRKNPSKESPRVFTTDVTRLPPERPVGTDNPLASGRPPIDPRFPVSAWAGHMGPGQLSETSKFTSTEQQHLIEMKSKLVSLEREFGALCSLLLQDGGANCGLPGILEVNRTRHKGQTFSLEDAKRELANPWFLRRVGSYVSFIDHALSDRLDPAEAVLPATSLKSSHSRTPRTSELTLLPKRGVAKGRDGGDGSSFGTDSVCSDSPGFDVATRSSRTSCDIYAGDGDPYFRGPFSGGGGASPIVNACVTPMSARPRASTPSCVSTGVAVNAVPHPRPVSARPQPLSRGPRLAKEPWPEAASGVAVGAIAAAAAYATSVDRAAEAASAGPVQTSSGIPTGRLAEQGGGSRPPSRHERDRSSQVSTTPRMRCLGAL
eukprot:TRINITY_DN30983_c0_g1_i1.p1 TRINITY_DN30983_c0_g1~~TRINITY_DN30983_c0_g1_i1.p1  ORF type:complete len:434 (-),score=54.26 TRINITY_DN30983_c0_g1_i1:157-1458(-)